VRSRLVLLIAIPTLTAVVLGGISILSYARSASADGRVQQLATLSSNITLLSQRLEEERDRTVYYIALGTAGGRDQELSAGKAVAQTAAELSVIAQDYTLTNKSSALVLRELNGIGSGFSAQAQQEAATARTALGNLTQLRTASTKTHLPALVVVQKYTGVIDDLLALIDVTGQGTNDATLGQDIRVLSLVSRMKEEASEQRGILTIGLLTKQLTANQLSSLNAALSEQQSNLQSFDTSASTAQKALWNNTVASSFVFQANAEETQAISTAQDNGANSLSADPTNVDDWYGAMTNEIDTQMGSVEQSLNSQITSRAAQLHKDALTYAVVVGLAVLIVLGLALFLTVVVGRSMVRPLRRLRAGALEVAGVRLPDMVRRMSESDGAGVSFDVAPIDVDSSDEIGEVARAFDQVHREALRLAANEAALRGNVNAMFVNLSRRSQSLVERQIRLIDDLEQGEQDPERLSNLFQMDHLATRMRRNSENLLVLAGHEVSRRWNQPVALVDVLRAAVSEIEQYERVSMNVQPGIAVRGQAVNDVVHLVAELVENATSFSSAETPVTVSGHLLNSGGALLDISDQGMGMGDQEMAHDNWRLDNPPVVDVAVSRRMGLFVVARLAARHGIRVRLRPATAGGLTALVWLPDETVTYEGIGSPPAPRRLSSDRPDAHDSRDTRSTLGTARFPQFTRRHGDTDGDAAAVASFPAQASRWEDRPSPAASAPPVTSPGQPSGDTGPISRETPVPPAVTLGAGQGPLPIFESVESDWFRRSRRSPARTPAAIDSTRSSSWTSAADEGWRAAEAVSKPTSGGATVSGLPKRVPRANLVPGTVRADGPVVSPPSPVRSAAATRDRFASYQRGVQEARAAARDDGDAAGQGNGVT
jgi:Nitrate and nitrite sensing/HAMP domain